MYGQLGAIELELLSLPTSWSESISADLPEQKRIGVEANLQFTGVSPMSVPIGFRWSVLFCDPEANWKALKAAIRSGEQLSFVTGDVYRGEYVIEQVGRTVIGSKPDGTITMIEVNLTMRCVYDPWTVSP